MSKHNYLYLFRNLEEVCLRDYKNDNNERPS